MMALQVARQTIHQLSSLLFDTTLHRQMATTMEQTPREMESDPVQEEPQTVPVWVVAVVDITEII